MAQAQYNPMNALRRARDFESSGDKDKALDHLYEILAARRMGRQWQPAHEQMMIKFIELSVEYREARKCKEGLHAYRNLAQQQQPASLEKVVLYLIDLSMRKAAEARARTDSVAQLDKVEDLEEEESPETLLMGAVTSEGSRDRAEREILVPWVRHMWDTYRNVLDTLRNTPLENLYHVVARRAMAFCKEYNRVAEYRKLTALLRTHLINIRRNLDTAGKGLSTESVEKHVATRFVQLEHCAEMVMWNEGFRTIEDIHEIMEGAGFTPKPQLMATYYEKLARIFWVSENYLFHAYAWYRFFALSSSQNRALSEEDRRTLANGAVLAALSIPIYGSVGGAASGGAAAGGNASSFDVDVNERDKKSALANLLRVPAAVGGSLGLGAGGVPSRANLLAELNAKGVVRLASPEVAAIARALESEFDPMGIVAKAKTGLNWVAAQTGPTLPPTIGIIGSSSAVGAHSLSQYGPKLERLTVFRLLEQLSSVYSSVTVAHFTGLIAPLKLSFQDVEKIAVRSVKERLLAVRIDHRAGTLRLGSSEGLDSSSTRRQLAELAGRLQVILDGTAAGEGSEAAAAFVVPPRRKEEVLNNARSMVDAARRWLHERKQTLHRRREREQMERIQAQRQADDKAAKDAEFYRAQEAKRLAEEEAARVEAKRKEIEEELKKIEMMKMMAAVRPGKSAKDLQAMASAHMDMATLQAQAQDRARKELETETRQRTEQARRVDYLIRALREAEQPKIKAFLSTLQASQEAHVRAHNDAVLARARKQFDDAVALKSSLAKMMPFVGDFEARVMAKRVEQHASTRKSKLDAERVIFLRAKRERALKRKEIEERRQAEENERKRESDRKRADAEEEERLRARDQKRLQQDEESRRAREEASGPGDFRRLGGSERPSASGPSAVGPDFSMRPTATGPAYVPPNLRGGVAGDGAWRAGGAAPAASAAVPSPAAGVPPAAAGGKYVAPGRAREFASVGAGASGSRPGLGPGPGPAGPSMGMRGPGAPSSGSSSQAAGGRTWN